MSYDLVTGDTGSVLSITVLDSDTGLAKDLTACSVIFRWEGETGTVVNKTATISDAANGVVQYQFSAGEIFAPKMRVEVEVTDGAGFIVTGTDLITLQVREQLG